MAFASLKQKINIRYFMAAYLAALLVYAAFSFAGPINLLTGLAIVILYPVFDLVWTFVRDKVWYFPLSSFISGFVLAIVSAPDLPVFAIVLLPLLAVFSKQALHFGKMRHVLNPAAFAMGIMGFFYPAVTWWATGWNFIPLIVVAIVSAFILWRQERWHVAIPFAVSWSVFLSIFLLVSGVTLQKLPEILSTQLLNGTVLFFATVMVIEPLTSAFPTRRQRMIYGLFVALFSIMALAVLRMINWGYHDPLILGLLAGNLAAGLLFLPNRKKDMIST